ncbi:MAG: hypothetical protein IKK53_01985 [Ruminiclostridium sp.]|nr:hypothetical protein [Ruminiclostridium sp.]
MNRIIRKITALLAAAMSVTMLPLSAYAQAATPPAQTEENSDPSLNGAAFNAGISLNKTDTKVEENDNVGVTVTTYIPIDNFAAGMTAEDFDTGNIFSIAESNDSFDCLTNYSWEDSYSIVGSFLRIDSYFIDVIYLGKSNVFSYKVCYNAGGSSVSVPLTCTVPECVETVPEEEPEKEEVTTPSFTLAPGSSFSIKAGETKNINVGLKSVGRGYISVVSAMLTSATPDVTVEDVGEKTSTSLSPSFSFKIRASEAASAGVYTLTLNVNVFGKDGAAAGNYTYNLPVKVESNVNASALSIKSYKTSKQEIRSGDKFDLSVTLENNCGIDLENIEVTLAGLDATKFVLDGGFSKQTVSIKKGKTGKVTFPLVACDGISSVRESIGIQAVYNVNPAKPDTAQSLETSVIVTCVPESDKKEMGKHDLTMTDYSVSSPAVAENTRFTLSVTLKNSSETKIENARLNILGLDGSKFAINSGLTYRDFNIEAGKTKTFNFEIVGCKGISSIREVIPLLIEYGTVSSEVSVTIPCYPSETSDGENDNFAPNIIIESYDFGGEFVTAGETFRLNVKLKNTSSSSIIENLKVTINGEPSTTDGTIAFSPANSSNSFFFETLAAKDISEISLDLLSKVDAVPNSYPLQLSFTYEYRSGGKRYQGSPVTETITIPLQQEDRLTVNQPEYPSYAVNVGEMCYISTSLVNKGKSGVYNVTATVEGEGFDLNEKSYYIGNINSGSEEYYDVQLTPNMEGEISGEIVITYEDANGTEKEQRKPFSFTAMQFNYEEMYPADDFFVDPGMTDPMPVAPEGGFNIVPLIIGVVVVIGVIVTIVIIVKKRKQKRELEDDDEDI